MAIRLATATSSGGYELGLGAAPPPLRTAGDREVPAHNRRGLGCRGTGTGTGTCSTVTGSERRRERRSRAAVESAGSRGRRPVVVAAECRGACCHDLVDAPGPLVPRGVERGNARGESAGADVERPHPRETPSPGKWERHAQLLRKRPADPLAPGYKTDGPQIDAAGRWCRRPTGAIILCRCVAAPGFGPRRFKHVRGVRLNPVDNRGARVKRGGRRGGRAAITGHERRGRGVVPPQLRERGRHLGRHGAARGARAEHVVEPRTFVLLIFAIGSAGLFEWPYIREWVCKNVMRDGI
jgi:hypothetical protein